MVKLGMIGYNEGNGHPYSFSAIINGYNPLSMEKSPYPVIAKYLSERTLDEFGIEGLTVTHVWSPNMFISKDIANCGLIPNVVSNYQDLLTCDIDAIIIARDDVDSHFELVEFFLKEGLPVFVDKPLCNRMDQLDALMPYLENAKLMSCSGLRYQPDIVNLFNGELRREEICFVNTLSLLDWDKYGIHVLEAITPIMGYDIKRVLNLNDNTNYLVKVEYNSGQYALIQINDRCLNPMFAEFYIKNRSYKTVFNQNFICFKAMLTEFNKMLLTHKPSINPTETYAIIKTIIQGKRNA